MATKNPVRDIEWVLNLISDCATRSCRLPKGHSRDNTIRWEDTNSPWSLLWEWHYLCGNILHSVYHICIRHYRSVAISAQTKLVQEGKRSTGESTRRANMICHKTCRLNKEPVVFDMIRINSTNKNNLWTKDCNSMLVFEPQKDELSERTTTQLLAWKLYSIRIGRLISQCVRSWIFWINKRKNGIPRQLRSLWYVE